jgi:hypothetical protein
VRGHVARNVPRRRRANALFIESAMRGSQQRWMIGEPEIVV